MIILMQKGFSAILAIVGLAIVLLVGGGLFYVGRSTAPKTQSDQTVRTSPSSVVQSSNPQAASLPSQSTSTSDSNGMKTYEDKKNGFTLKYSSDAKVTTQTLYSMLSFAPSEGVSIAPPSQAPYSKWYSLDIVVRDNPQNLSEKTIIDNYITEVQKNCSPPSCGTPKMIQDSLKPYSNGEVKGYIFHIGAETDSAMVIQVKNSKVYIFRLVGDSGNLPDQWSDILDKLLSLVKYS